MHSRSRGPVVAAGLALILLPPLALLLKLAVYPGWMLVIVIWGGLPLLLGYALQVVIASLGMLRRRGVFNTAPGAGRGLGAAWMTSASVLLAVFFLVDGGDDGVYGSAFTALLGVSSTGDGEQLSMMFFPMFVMFWLAGWAWLVVEWIVLSVRSRRASRATPPVQAPR